MKCNIGAKGKAMRLIIGVVTIFIGIILGLGSYYELIIYPKVWIVTSLMIGGGAFAIFEARKGWCIVRAAGFKTPI